MATQNKKIAPEEMIRDLAATIARQADALAAGTVIGPRAATVIRLRENIATLEAWIGDDRPHTRRRTS